VSYFTNRVESAAIATLVTSVRDSIGHLATDQLQPANDATSGDVGAASSLAAVS
jgi:hypothetical protein